MEFASFYQSLCCSCWNLFDAYVGYHKWFKFHHHPPPAMAAKAAAAAPAAAVAPAPKHQSNWQTNCFPLKSKAIDVELNDRSMMDSKAKHKWYYNQMRRIDGDSAMLSHRRHRIAYYEYQYGVLLLLLLLLFWSHVESWVMLRCNIMRLLWNIYSTWIRLHARDIT